MTDVGWSPEPTAGSSSYVVPLLAYFVVGDKAFCCVGSLGVQGEEAPIRFEMVLRSSMG